MQACRQSGFGIQVRLHLQNQLSRFRVAALATSHNNLEDIKAQLKNQTIGHDKVNQLRHVRFFGDIHGMVEHMRKHADIIRPQI